jgi:hypothetical protein
MRRVALGSGSSEPGTVLVDAGPRAAVLCPGSRAEADQAARGAAETVRRADPVAHPDPRVMCWWT